eukprot:1666935-Amphidinium_carterae.1
MSICTTKGDNCPSSSKDAIPKTFLLSSFCLVFWRTSANQDQHKTNEFSSYPFSKIILNGAYQRNFPALFGFSGYSTASGHTPCDQW